MKGQHKEPYIYDIYTEGGWGRGLDIRHVFADSIFLSNRSVVYFCGWWRLGRGEKKVIFCGSHKLMTPKTTKKHLTKLHKKQ